MQEGRGWGETDRVSVPGISDKPSRYSAVPYHIRVIILHQFPTGFPLDDVLSPLISHGNVGRMLDCPIRIDGSTTTITSVQSRTCIAFKRSILSQCKLSYDPFRAIPFHDPKVYKWSYSPSQLALL